MLQRAASNAYSWWWASRIRTNQSKWLDGNLQEMNDRVTVILKLLGEEADSFAKRAEMYYKRRPEVISNVEEAYRAYRALAERYDHVSGELHKANHTIAAAFPEQVQYAMLEDDDEDDSEHAPKAITPIDPSKIRKSTVEGLLKKKKRDKEKEKRKPKSNLKLSIEKAQAEIDRLQKAILVLQTEKEFIKSSYESGIAKYWEIEKQMVEMQEEVCSLQDQSGATGTVIEDEEARALMTATALKSCEEAIVRLKEQQKESAEQARVESERIQVAIEKLNSIKAESNEPAQNQELTESTESTEPIKIFDEAEGIKVQQQDQLDVICEKVKQHFEMNPETSVEEIANKIDELVCKVIELEMTVSSLNTRINHLSAENGELEKHLKKLDEEKTGLFNGSNDLNIKLKEAEKELKSVKDLEKSVKEEERAVANGFTEVVNCLRNVSKKFETGEVKETNVSSKENMVDFFQSESAYEKNSFEEKDQKVGPDSGPTVGDAASSSVIGEEDVKEIVEVHEIKEELVKDQTVESLEEEKVEERESKENALQILEHNATKIMGKEEDEVRDEKEPKMTEDKGEIFSQNSEIVEIDLLKASKNKYRRGISLQQGEEQYAPLTETVPNFRGEEKDGALSWQELLLDGLEGRDKILLADYTAILRSYKETTKRLNEVEKRNQEQFSEMARLVQELRKDNALKDEEIRSLMQLLSSFKMNSSGSDVVADGSSAIFETENLERKSDSSIEEKLKVDIDSMFEENFKFMLRISASLNRTQEFETRYKKIESELKKAADKCKEDSSKGSLPDSDAKSKPETTEKRLRDLKTELDVWLEQITLLKQELQGRVSSLTGMRDEISEAVRSSTAIDGSRSTAIDGSRLSVFQGEVLGLQLGSDKAEIELRAGLDVVSGIRIKVDSELSKIKESFELPRSESERNTKWEHFKQHPSKSRVPLRNFLFGPKPKPKKKPSFFACINPVFQKQYSDRE